MIKYIKIKSKLREIIKIIAYQKMQLVCSIIFLLIGYCYYKKISYKYGSDVNVIFLRGATGDTFLAGRWMEHYLEENEIKKVIFLGDAGNLKDIFALYGYNNVEPISHFLAVCFQQFSLLCNNRKIHSMFLWPHTRYFNRCRFRMVPPFTFYDTYIYYVFDFKSNPRIVTPIFSEVNEICNNKFQRHNTVIISPYANSVKFASEKFWYLLIDRLKDKGFEVVVNCSKKENNFGCKRIFFKYKNSKAVLEYCGYFIGLRSGLCDIVASANCIKLVLYPLLLSNPNYSEHRSDIQFCSLKTLQLTEDVIELDSALISNITDQDIILSKEEIEKEEKILLEKIMYQITKSGGKNES